MLETLYLSVFITEDCRLGNVTLESIRTYCSCASVTLPLPPALFL